MNYAVPTTSFKNIAKANEVTLKIYLWVTHRIPHARLRGEVHHDFKLMLLEQLKELDPNPRFRHERTEILQSIPKSQAEPI